MKAVVEIARHYPEGPVSLAWIARVRRLPLPYLEQIIPLLRKAGLVESARGARGGYRLAKPPEEISVGDVLRALEGEVFSIPCPVSEAGCIIVKRGCCCSEEEVCGTRELLGRTHALLFSFLDKVTIAELVERMPPECPEVEGTQCPG